jgi:hypothetical protein
MTTESKCAITPRRHPEITSTKQLCRCSLGSPLLLYASLLLFCCFAGCSSKEEKPTPPPPAVTVTPVVRKDIQQEWVETILSVLTIDCLARLPENYVRFRSQSMLRREGGS